MFGNPSTPLQPLSHERLFWTLTDLTSFAEILLKQHKIDGSAEEHVLSLIHSGLASLKDRYEHVVDQEDKQFEADYRSKQTTLEVCEVMHG